MKRRAKALPACPKCERAVQRAEYDSMSIVGWDGKTSELPGATVLRHGPGHPIGDTGLTHADSCVVVGRWPAHA